MKLIKVPNLFTVNKAPRCLPCYISPLPGYNTNLGRSRLLRLLVLVIRRDVDTGRASLFTYACTEFSSPIPYLGRKLFLSSDWTAAQPSTNLVPRSFFPWERG